MAKDNSKSSRRVTIWVIVAVLLALLIPCGVLGGLLWQAYRINTIYEKALEVK